MHQLCRQELHGDLYHCCHEQAGLVSWVSWKELGDQARLQQHGCRQKARGAGCPTKPSQSISEGPKGALAGTGQTPTLMQDWVAAHSQYRLGEKHRAWMMSPASRV